MFACVNQFALIRRAVTALDPLPSEIKETIKRHTYLVKVFEGFEEIQSSIVWLKNEGHCQYEQIDKAAHVSK